MKASCPSASTEQKGARGGQQTRWKALLLRHSTCRAAPLGGLGGGMGLREPPVPAHTSAQQGSAALSEPGGAAGSRAAVCPAPGARCGVGLQPPPLQTQREEAVVPGMQRQDCSFLNPRAGGMKGRAPWDPWGSCWPTFLTPPPVGETLSCAGSHMPC